MEEDFYVEFGKIKEIYNNSNEIEKLIFKEVLKDLLWWVIEFWKPKEKQLKDVINVPSFKWFEIEWNEVYYKFILDSIKEYELNQWKSDYRIWLFNYTKPRGIISKEIKEYYHTFLDDELNIVNDYRKVVLYNLEKCNFITLFSKDEREDFELISNKVKELFDLRKKKLLFFWNKKKVKLMNDVIWQITNFFLIDRTEEELNKIIYESKFDLFTCYLSDLKDLYSDLFDEKISDEIEFYKDKWILRYKWKNMIVKEWWKPYDLLCELFNIDIDEWIPKDELFFSLMWTDDYRRYYQERRKITDLVNWINDRFRKTFNTKKNLLVCRWNTIYRQY